jgi:Glycosyl transferase family 2
MKRIALLQFHKDWEVCRNRAQLLRAMNPGLEIHGLFGGDPEKLEEAQHFLGTELDSLYLLRHPDREWNRKNTDLAVRSWYRDFGAHRDFDVAHSVQWDLLLLAPLSVLYRDVPGESVGLTGLTTVDAIADRWHWTQNEPHRSDFVRLKELVERRFGYDMPFRACLGPGYCLPRKFLDAYAHADVPELGHDEIRLPLYAAILGFEVADTGFYPRWFDTLEERFFNAASDDIDEQLIRSELARPRGRRAFHPFRREFALARAAAPAGGRRKAKGRTAPEATREKADTDRFRVVAIIAAYNESDIISPLLEHLVENGVESYLIDNRSTDGTVAEARRWLGKGLLEIEMFPKEAPSGETPAGFDWEGILRRKEEIARELGADWYIHNDADEFREAPWPGMRLADAVRWVDRLGYNCIDFRVLNFRPVDDAFPPGADPKAHITRWEEPILHDRVRLNCWKAQKDPVSLAASGGHEVRFPGRRVFPIRFLLRHYPVRSQEHGERKIFEERKNRFLERERAKGWHVQYDDIPDSGHSFVGDPESLHPYDGDRVRLGLLLENEAARSAEDRVRDLSAELEARRLEVAGLQSGKHEAEKHAANLERDRQKLTQHLIERERHVANLESNAAELQRHATGLEKDREVLAGHIAHLEEVRAEKDRHLARLEDMRAEQSRHTASLEATLAAVQRHASGLEGDRETLQKHIDHLEAVREEKDRHIALLQSEKIDRERHVANLESLRAGFERQAAAFEEERRRLKSSVRDLEDRFAAMRTRANNEEALRRETESRASTLARELNEMRRSTAWRITAPLRWMADRLKSIFR